MKEIYLHPAIVNELSFKVLVSLGVRKTVARDVTEGLIQTSLRGIDSHGIRLLSHYVAGVRGGRINPQPKYKFKKTAYSTGILDADHTFGHAAGMEGARRAIRLARKAGTAHIAIYNSTHFGAASCYALEIARHDMIGMAFTNTDALIRSHAGKRPFLGNNPISFAAPCDGEEPFCLDMATSIVTFNKIRQFREKDVAAPVSVGADRYGRETTDPHEITMLLPVGGYKGYGLSMVVEILCSLLTGMPYGPNIPKMFEAPMSAKRFLGHFVIAMRIDCFQKKSVFKKRLSEMMKALRNEPSLKKGVSVQVAGDPEKRAYGFRSRAGIPVSETEYAAIRDLAHEFKVEFPGSR